MLQSLSLFHHPRVIVRLVVILFLFSLAAGFMAIHEQEKRELLRGKYGVSWHVLLQADLMYRMGAYLELVRPGYSWPFVREARLLQERAIAEYERAALAESPHPAAWHRLGLIYGERGFLKQAHEAFMRAAALDAPHASFFWSLAQLYSPENGNARMIQVDWQRWQRESPWLTAMALIRYYERMGDEKRTQEARQWANRQIYQFGRKALILASLYGGLALIGFLIVLIAFFRWAFLVPSPRPPRPQLIVPWDLLDSLEIVAFFYFFMLVTSNVLGYLLPYGSADDSDIQMVSIVALQYFLATGGVLWLIRRRLKGISGCCFSSWIRMLGLRGHRPVQQVIQGIGGYAVLIILFVSLAYFLPGQRLFISGQIGGLAQAGQYIILQTRTVPARIILFVMICLLAPVLEEAIFRGYVYAGMRRRLRAPAAVLGSALLFGLLHNNLAVLAPVTLIGGVSAVLYERNLSLWPSIICHALNNTLVFMLLLLGM